jgi:C-terminal processing protease CtpA/Prc
VGWVHRGFIPSIEEASQYALPDDLSAQIQLERLTRDGALSLMSHSQQLCYSGPVLVLVDEETASVAEIFAQAMKERPETRVLGWPTAGQVVMARWFELDSIGPGYNLVLPVARYDSAKGQTLERRGVRPDVELIRDLQSTQRLGDPWLHWADEYARSGRFPSGASVSF